MAPLTHSSRAPPRRNLFSAVALFSVLVLGILAVSVLHAGQERRFAPSLEELEDIDFENHEEVKEFLASKVRASAGDQYL